MPKGFKQDKAVSVLLYLAHKEGNINLFILMNMLYFADKEHFQKWGRTITGDEYKAEDFGPLPYKIYHGLIREVQTDYIFDSDLAKYFVVDNETIIPKQEPDRRKLSKSDIDVLDRVYEQHKDEKSTAKEDPTYLKFLNSGRSRMTLEDFADSDPSLLAHLKEVEENEMWLKRFVS